MAIFVLNRLLEPESVTSLNATTDEEAILLTWARPGGYKPSYRYLVKWHGLDGLINDTETTQEKLAVSSLSPGSHYRFTVITATLDDTPSDAVELSNCTSMSLKESNILMRCSIINVIIIIIIIIIASKH